jgi:hypothetical protein
LLKAQIHDRILEYDAEFYADFDVAVNTIFDRQKYVKFVVRYFKVK